MTPSRRYFFGLMAVVPLAAKAAAEVAAPIAPPDVPWPSPAEIGERLQEMLPPSIKEKLTRNYTPWSEG
jgi:hypothetical protein